MLADAEYSAGKNTSRALASNEVHDSRSRACFELHRCVLAEMLAAGRIIIIEQQ